MVLAAVAEEGAVAGIVWRERNLPFRAALKSRDQGVPQAMTHF
jgi:hypothetical protein